MKIIDRLLPADCYSANVALAPTGLLIHSINGSKVDPDRQYDPELCWQILRDLHVSAHYLITREGDVWRLVPEDRKAWHAGLSHWRGEVDLNRQFLGIELIGSEDDEFTGEQYAAAAALAGRLRRQYNIPTLRIRGHEDVSDVRIRSKDPKHDPGQSFDWIRFGWLLMQAGAP